MSAIPDDYRALIGSDRVSDRLREALLDRAEPDDPAYRPRTMSPAQLATLRAALDRIIPQDPAGAIDLAARLDRMMAEASGNGWRYEALPTDPDAYRIGLDTLEALALARGGRSFSDLSGTQQDDLLTDIEEGGSGIDGRPDLFDAAQMTLWFEELRSDGVRHYVAHPATLARLGYSVIAIGGRPGAAFAGFEKIGIGERDAFEPTPAAGGAAA